MAKSLHELSKEMLNKANLEVLTETGKLKKEETPAPKDVVVEHSLSASIGRVPKAHPELRKKLSQKDDQDKKIPNSLASYRDRIYKAKTKQLRKEDDVEEDIDARIKHLETAHTAEMMRNNPKAMAKVKKDLAHARTVKTASHMRDKPLKEDDKDPPFDADEKKSTDWSSARNKAKNLARAAMKKQVEKKKVNEAKEESYEAAYDPDLKKHLVLGISTGKTYKAFDKKDDAIAMADKLNTAYKTKNQHHVIAHGYHKHVAEDLTDLKNKAVGIIKQVYQKDKQAMKATGKFLVRGQTQKDAALEKQAQHFRSSEVISGKKEKESELKKGAKYSKISGVGPTDKAVRDYKFADESVTEDKIKPDSKIKVGGKYVFGNTKGNVAHIEGDKTKKLTTEMDRGWGHSASSHPHGDETWDDSAKRKKEAKDRAKEARGKRKKEPYLPFGKALPRHRIGQNHMTEVELAELSDEKVRKYHATSHLEIGKASAHRTFAASDAKHNPSPENEKKYQDAKNTVRKRIRGHDLAKKKLGEDDVNELSVEKLHQYRKKAMSQIVPNWNPKSKRVQGVYKAEKKIENKTGVKQFDVGAS